MYVSSSGPRQTKAAADLAELARLQHASRTPLLLSLQPSLVQLVFSQALMVATGLSAPGCRLRRLRYDRWKA